MKVLIDISRLHPAALKRGVGVYARQLAEALNQEGGPADYFLKTQADGPDWQRAELIHFPYFDPFFLTLPWLRERPVVVTVHDLIPLKFPEHFPRGIRGSLKWLVQKFILKQSTAIISDSRSSAKDIITRLNYPRSRVFPIPLAVDRRFNQLKDAGRLREVRQKYQLPKQFVFYVGDLNWSKNVSGLVRAFAQLVAGEEGEISSGEAGSEKKAGLKLVLAGSAFENHQLKELKELKDQLKNLALEEKVVLLGFVPWEDLVALYNLAMVYVQPSFYEGFGLPVLEAISCGCPVLSSDQASLPEVGGQAVEYFNPHNQGELAKSLKQLCRDPARRKSLAKQGLKRAKQFSWTKTAQQTIEVYDQVLKQGW